MGDRGQITIREARLADKEAVLNIRDDVYGGRDYLMAYYDRFVTSKNCLPYVAIVKAEIIAFAAAWLVDGMKTVVSRAGRVSPKHHGKRLPYLMFQAAMPRFRDFGVTDEAFIIKTGNKIRHAESYRGKQILQREFLRYLIDGSKWIFSKTQNTIHSSTNRIPEATDLDLASYFSTQTYRDYLFPDNVMVIDFVPYQPIETNLKTIRNFPNRLILSDVRSEGHSIKGMLSITTLFQCSANFYACNLDIFGQDTSSFKQHLLLCMEFVTSKTNGSISLFIFIDPKMDKVELESAAYNLGLTNHLASMDFHQKDKDEIVDKLSVYKSKL